MIAGWDFIFQKNVSNEKYFLFNFVQKRFLYKIVTKPNKRDNMMFKEGLRTKFV